MVPVIIKAFELQSSSGCFEPQKAIRWVQLCPPEVRVGCHGSTKVSMTKIQWMGSHWRFPEMTLEIFCLRTTFPWLVWGMADVKGSTGMLLVLSCCATYLYDPSHSCRQFEAPKVALSLFHRKAFKCNRLKPRHQIQHVSGRNRSNHIGPMTAKSFIRQQRKGGQSRRVSGGPGIANSPFDQRSSQHDPSHSCRQFEAPKVALSLFHRKAFKCNRLKPRHQIQHVSGRNRSNHIGPMTANSFIHKLQQACGGRRASRS